MPNPVQIKRSQLTATPPSLLVGELAYSEASNTLFIGVTGNQVIGIAGVGLFSRKNDSFGVTGDATGTGTLSGGVSLTLVNTGITPGTYTKLTIDGKGRATAGSALLAEDIPNLTVAKLTDFNTSVAAFKLNQFALPTGDLSLNNYRITNLATPVNANDAATKTYVDSAVQGLKPKASVKAATTANIATLSGAMTIDGVSLVAGDRVLVKDQTTSHQNGIYVVSASAWTRALDADVWGELVSAFTFVEQGTANADVGFVCTVDQGGTIGSTAVSFVPFTGASSVIAGNGLNKTGNTIFAVGTANRITVSSSGIDIASNYAGQTSINTLGTVTTGTWQANIIGLAYGGTGANLTALSDGTVLKKVGTAIVAATAGTDYLNSSSTIDGGTF